MISADPHMGKATRPKVSVIVPVYNRIGLTLEFLRSFQHVTYANYEIILVDDGSTDGTPDAVEQEYPAVLVLRTEGDLWWSRCMNRGLDIALTGRADYVLTINDDVAVAPTFLSALVAYAEEHPRTLVGSLIYEFNHKERLWYAGGKVNWLEGELVHRSSLHDGKLCWLTAMGTLVPAAAFLEVGYYDADHLPQYTADAEFSLRAREKGFSLAVIPGSVLWNKSEESSQRLVRKNVTLRTFFLPLTSKKSDALLSMRLYLYRRHWPFFLRPAAMMSYYAKFAAKQTKRIIIRS
jgi:GT2 family glycosyltransferase